jgi:hypothetical protein
MLAKLTVFIMIKGINRGEHAERFGANPGFLQ